MPDSLINLHVSETYALFAEHLAMLNRRKYGLSLQILLAVTYVFVPRVEKRFFFWIGGSFTLGSDRMTLRRNLIGMEDAQPS